HPFQRFIHPYYDPRIFFVRKNAGVNQLQYLLQVLILRFFFFTNDLESGIDLIETLAQGLKVNRSMFHIEVSREIAVVNRFDKFIQLSMSFSLKAKNVDDLVNKNGRRDQQINIPLLNQNEGCNG